ncbi:hypothetical protein ITP53_03435 [Nonomuraea sp. K274]|uniref:Uncharacterized protein n=1 Tax=Nonomuraea cypriaca TaxID=1187855 RepID=A0A931A4U9_9ACTN|nr:hypothetical protein [Nonomuraea cypriaca]MBF8184809.1 hypothetical protein [Nonomuraea cypriaca]
MRVLIGVWSWAAGHRIAWGVLAAVVWTALVYLFVDNMVIALLCGAAFGAVSAATLPPPPSSS